MRILSVRRIATRRACHRSPPEGAPAPVMVSSQRGHRRVRQATDLSVLFSYTFRAGPAGGFPPGWCVGLQGRGQPGDAELPRRPPRVRAVAETGARAVGDPGRYLRPDRCTSVGVIRAPGPRGPGVVPARGGGGACGDGGFIVGFPRRVWSPVVRAAEEARCSRGAGRPWSPRHHHRAELLTPPMRAWAAPSLSTPRGKPTRALTRVRIIRGRGPRFRWASPGSVRRRCARLPPSGVRR